LSTIGELDDSNAALRLLIALHRLGKPIMLSELYDQMRSKYGLGRRTVDTALETCARIGLVKRETKRIGKNPMPSIFQALTPKGKKAAEICSELERALT